MLKSALLKKLGEQERNLRKPPCIGKNWYTRFNAQCSEKKTTKFVIKLRVDARFLIWHRISESLRLLHACLSRMR